MIKKGFGQTKQYSLSNSIPVDISLGINKYIDDEVWASFSRPTDSH